MWCRRLVSLSIVEVFQLILGSVVGRMLGSPLRIQQRIEPLVTLGL